MEKYRKLWTYVRIIGKETAGKVLLLTAVSSTYLVQAAGAGLAVWQVLFQGHFSGIPLLAAAIGAAVILRAFLTWYLEGYTKKMAAKAKTAIRLELMDQLFALGPQYVNTQRSGRIQSLLLDGIEKLEPFLVNYVPLIFSIGTTGLLLGLGALWMDRVTGLVLLAAMALCLLIPCLTVPLLKLGIVDYWAQYTLLNAQYVDALQGITTLKAFNSSKAKGKELEADAWEFYRRQIRNTAYSLLDSGLIILMTSAAAFLSVGVGAWRAWLGLIPAEAILIFLFLTAECARPMVELNQAWHSSFMGLAACSHIFALLDQEIRVQSPAAGNTRALDQGLPEIRFDHVTFRYPGSPTPALEDVSFTIPGGQTAALVGMSGSGKSTILSLLLRFYDPQAGRICLNGVDLRDFDLNYLRRHISPVFQENYLFAGTLRENLIMGAPDASEETIRQAVRASGAAEFLDKLPNGLDSTLGERGLDLSGGQRQRLAIARAMVKQAPLMLFDEATSNVDAENEARITHGVEALSRHTTSLIIAHRLSTVRHAQCIYVLHEGRLAESGTHEALLEKHGIYETLIQAQRGGEDA